MGKVNFKKWIFQVSNFIQRIMLSYSPKWFLYLCTAGLFLAHDSFFFLRRSQWGARKQQQPEEVHHQQEPQRWFADIKARLCPDGHRSHPLGRLGSAAGVSVSAKVHRRSPSSASQAKRENCTSWPWRGWETASQCRTFTLQVICKLF